MTSTIARPYAKAAFIAATQAHQLLLWSKSIKNLSLAVQDKKMRAFIKNPAATQQHLIKILIEVLRKTTSKESANNTDALENFIRVLAEKKRLPLLPFISDLFEEALAKAEGYLALTVTSAYPMDDTQKNNVKEKLSQQLQSKLHIEYDINESVMGGLLVRSKDWVLDGTVTGQLQRLKSVISNR